jgi:hypothetical protein
MLMNTANPQRIAIASIVCVTLLVSAFRVVDVARADQFSSASPNSGEVSCRKTLPTSGGISGPADHATSSAVFVPRQWSDQLCVYLAAGMELLAPKGWTGRGSIGADGGRNAQLHLPNPTSPEGPSLAVTDCSATFYCGATDSAPLFGSVRARWKTYDLGMPMPTPLPGLSVHKNAAAMGPDSMFYSLPNTRSGLIVNGVAYAGILDCKRTMFLQMQTALAPHDSGLAQIMLEFYRQRYIEDAIRNCS